MKNSKILNFLDANKWYILVFIVVAIIIGFYLKDARKKYPNVTAKQREMIETLHPSVKTDFYRWANECQKNKDVVLEFTSAYRSYLKQKSLQKSAGKIAANAGTSPHNYGLAIDTVVYYKGKRLGLAASKSEWLKSGVPQVARKLSMTWGGDFVNWTYDPVHFDVCKKYGIKPSLMFAAGKKIFGSPEKIIGTKIPLSKGKVA